MEHVMDNIKTISFEDHNRKVTIIADHNTGIVTMIESLDDDGDTIITTTITELATALFFITSNYISGHAS